MDLVCYYTIAGDMDGIFEPNLMCEVVYYMYMISSLDMVSSPIQVWLYGGVSKSLVSH